MAKIRITLKDGTFADYAPGENIPVEAKNVYSIYLSPGESEEEGNKAIITFNKMSRFLSDNKAFLTSYPTDFWVWDRAMVFMHPGKPFVWVVRDWGTHFYLLDPAPENETNFVEMMNYFNHTNAGNALCFLWNPEKENLEMTTFNQALRDGLEIIKKARREITRC